MSLVTQGLLTLFQLDTTMLKGQLFYFSSAADFERSILWGGNEYVPLPIDASGFEYTTRGAIPQPNITISNIFGAANTLIDSYQGLVGAWLSRYVTLERFLDDGETPDPNAFISFDKYVVTQKTSHTAIGVVFKLASKIDQQGSQVPRRLIIRDFCSHTYRFWDATAGAFDYSKATCPYTGSDTFDPNNNGTSPPNDACSRNVHGCVLRFPGQALPGRFFPGVGRIR